MEKPHPRPEIDFRVTCLDWELDIERRQVDGGFEPVPREDIVRRYFQFLSFLQTHGMTSRTVCARIEDVGEDAEWRNSDLTDDGFYFVQRFHGRWSDRKRKDQGEAKEAAFLQKWLTEFRDKRGPSRASQTTTGLRPVVSDC
jgi:hypothetical protein